MKGGEVHMAVVATVEFFFFVELDFDPDDFETLVHAAGFFATVAFADLFPGVTKGRCEDGVENCV